MARDIPESIEEFLTSDTARDLAGTAVTKLLKGVAGRSNSKGGESPLKRVSELRSNGMSGVRGLAAGAGAAALAPVAVKGISKLVRGNGAPSLFSAPQKVAKGASSLAGGPKKLAEDAGSKLGETVGGKVTGKIDEAGGPSGILKDAVKDALPFGGGGGDDKHKAGVRGVGKGRRMPVQQSIDIGAPLETVYNQWTQFEEWPIFMHRITEVNQKDPCTVSFKTKIWGKTKEFEAKIETQRPDQRIKWEVVEGMSHSGVVTFHEITPTLTRVELGLDIEPGSMIEKAARGMRHVKRAARGDLHRFKAFIEMLENETGAWRGVIEEGEIVEDHDSTYDKKREYGSADELIQDDQSQDEEDDDEEQSGGGRQQRQSSPSRSSRSASKGSSSSKRKASSSRNGSSGRSSGAKASSRASSSRSASRSGSSSSKRSGSSASRSNGSSSRSSSGSARSSGGSRASSGRNGGSSGGSKSTRSRSRGSSNGSSGRSRSSSSRSHEGRRRAGSSRRS